MVTDEFRELNKETSKTLVKTLVERESRERGKKEREEIREEEERQRARQRARERENRRARFLAMAFWRRSDGVYTAEGPSSSPPTYSDVRVLENYYLNKYIHGGKFETSFFKIFFLNFKKKNAIQFAKARDH
jgi:hypothetical protein